MPTEREVLQLIVANPSEGLPGLFERHGALFRSGLLRFLGGDGVERAPDLARLANELVADLRADDFDDQVETFYNWVFRATWTKLVGMAIERAGGEHPDPQVLFDFSERANEEALPEDVRAATRAHLEGCELCPSLIERCTEVPVEVRTAGAPYTDEFQAVIDSAMAQLA